MHALPPLVAKLSLPNSRASWQRKRVSGLRKWSAEEWEARITSHPKEAAKLINALFFVKGKIDRGTLPIYPPLDTKGVAAALDATEWFQCHEMLRKGNTLLGDHTFEHISKEGAKELVGPFPKITQLAVDLRQKLAGPTRIAEWRAVLRFQHLVLNRETSEGAPLMGGEEEGDGQVEKYMEPALLSQMIFDREFPLGVEESIMRDDLSFAITHSGAGCHKIRHQESTFLSCLIYCFVLCGIFFFLVYLLYRMYGDPSIWTLEMTVQDTNNPRYSEIVTARGQKRGRVASLLNSMTFSLLVNASLDKFGLIDPSTSTVLVGMTLGGTWGFVLDNMFGTDEGFREYLWSPSRGMMYAMGCLATERFGRYIVTILFDMFFTVILFKQLYSRLVRAAGFTVAGREWCARAAAARANRAAAAACVGPCCGRAVPLASG